MPERGTWECARTRRGWEMGIRWYFWEPLALGSGCKQPGSLQVLLLFRIRVLGCQGKCLGSPLPPQPPSLLPSPPPAPAAPQAPGVGWGRRGREQELGRRREIWSLGRATFRSEGEMEFLALGCERGSGFPFNGEERDTKRGHT